MTISEVIPLHLCGQTWRSYNKYHSE